MVKEKNIIKGSIEFIAKFIFFFLKRKSSFRKVKLISNRLKAILIKVEKKIIIALQRIFLF
jgi:hypothetical protein